MKIKICLDGKTSITKTKVNEKKYNKEQKINQ